MRGARGPSRRPSPGDRRQLPAAPSSAERGWKERPAALSPFDKAQSPPSPLGGLCPPLPSGLCAACAPSGISAVSPPGAGVAPWLGPCTSGASFGLRFPAPEGPRGPHAAPSAAAPGVRVGRPGLRTVEPRDARQPPAPPRGCAPRAAQASRRLLRNYSQEGWDGFCLQLPTRNRLGMPSLGVPFPRVPGGEAIGAEREGERQRARGRWRGAQRGPGRLRGQNGVPRRGLACPAAAAACAQGGTGFYRQKRGPRSSGTAGRVGGGALRQCPGAAGSLGGKCGAQEEGTGVKGPGPFGPASDLSTRRRCVGLPRTRRCSDRWSPTTTALCLL